jgi:hypothetical protein
MPRNDLRGDIRRVFKGLAMQRALRSIVHIEREQEKSRDVAILWEKRTSHPVENKRKPVKI